MNVPEPALKNLAIVNEIPSAARTILVAGCGKGALDEFLISMGYVVYSTDIRDPKNPNINFFPGDILDLTTYPIRRADCVICSQVLEHIPDWRRATKNLIETARYKLIITVPWKTSFNDPEHVNYWYDGPNDRETPLYETRHSDYIPIDSFRELARGKEVFIYKTETTRRDIQMREKVYMVVVKCP